MNKKNLPTCVVSIAPINLSEMEHPKKKGSKSRQSTPVPQESQSTNSPAESSKNEAIEAKPETSNAQNVAKTNVNGKSKSKKEKNRSRSQTPATDKPVTNGVTDVALNANGTTNGDGNLLVNDESPEVIEEDALVPNSEQDNDELFPELIYDETSDNECNFDPASPGYSPVGRSVTRRSQAKIIPTPETPQMINSKQDTTTDASSSPMTEPSPENPDNVQSNEDTTQSDQPPSKEKVSKMKDLYSLTLKESQSDKKSKNDVDEGNQSKNEVASSVQHTKTETNFSKSRVKVSPYRRSTRISEQYSTIANYSGNNSTQETDIVEDITSSEPDIQQVENISESSSTFNCSQEAGQDDNKSYSDSMRSIKGRKSYRPLRELSLRNLTVQRQKLKIDMDASNEQVSASVYSVNATLGSETRDTILSEPSPKWTPVGHVVGRKRRQSPSSESHVATSSDSPALIVSEGPSSDNSDLYERPSKRQKLYSYISTPLRNLRDKMVSSTPIVTREAQAHPKLSHKEDVILTNTENSSDTPMDIQVPLVSNVDPNRAPPEHKWCLIM